MFQLVNKSAEVKNEVVRGPTMKTVNGVSKWHCIVELEGSFSQASAGRCHT